MLKFLHLSGGGGARSATGGVCRGAVAGPAPDQSDRATTSFMISEVPP